MNVTERNFFRLLTSGAFGADGDAVEPMSPWKWGKLHNLALMHGVVALVYDGIKRHEKDFFLQLPDSQKERWAANVGKIERASQTADACVAELFDRMNREQMRPILLRGQGIAALYDNPAHRTCGDIDIFFAYTPQAEKADKWAKANVSKAEERAAGILKYRWKGMKVEHCRQAMRLTNALLNRRLQGIITGEMSCCDSVYATICGTKVETLTPTLNLLVAMARLARYTMNDGIKLKQLVDLGMLLRKQGDKVDFLKLQKWIAQLRLKHMAQLEGALLVDLLGFTEDEVPFMDAKERKETDLVTRDLFMLTPNHTEEWHFTQGNNIFVRTNNSGAMTWQLRHLTRFFSCWPTEATTSFFHSIAHSLSHIEE